MAPKKSSGEQTSARVASIASKGLQDPGSLTKAQIIRRGLELGVDYSITRSCYDPDPPKGK